MTNKGQKSDKIKKGINYKTVNIQDLDLRKLKKQLRHGDIKEIADKTDFTPDYVSKVLNANNKRFNSAIVKTALYLIAEKYNIALTETQADNLMKER